MIEEYSFVSKIVGVLKNPEITFRHVTENDLIQASIIILISIMLSSWAGIVYRSKIPTAILLKSPLLAQMDQGILKQNMILLGAVRGTLSTLLYWIVPTAIIHLMTKPFNGSGSLKRFFIMMGFSYTPMIIQNVFRVIDAYTISPLHSGFLLMVKPETGIFVIISQLLRTYNVFRIASISLSSYAASINYGLDRAKALVIVLSSYLIFVLPSLL